MKIRLKNKESLIDFMNSNSDTVINYKSDVQKDIQLVSKNFDNFNDRLEHTEMYIWMQRENGCSLFSIDDLSENLELFKATWEQLFENGKRKHKIYTIHFQYTYIVIEEHTKSYVYKQKQLAQV